MVLDDSIQILQLKLLVPIKFNHIINYIPVLLHEVALVDVVSHKREAHGEFFHLWLVKLNTSKNNVPAGCADESFGVVIEAGGLHEKRERRIPLV